MNSPFNILRELESRTLKGVIGLPALDQIDDEWVGIGFRVGDTKLIASMTDVKEILDLPELTRVPGVQPWVVGVANVRGSLLPIMDMSGFLLGNDTKQRHKGRVIVIDYKGFDTGLVVEEVYGIRHFRESDESENVAELHESISLYVDRAYEQDGDSWPVFSFHEMIEEDRLTQATL